MVERSKNWETERYLYEKLKQTKIFRQWKKTQFDCQIGKCAWCEKPMQYRYTETDHIKPLYYGGNSEAENMVLCHHKCNKEKSTSTILKRPEWIKKNKYDEAVTKKYQELANSIHQEKTVEPNALENPIKTDNTKVKNTLEVPVLVGLSLLIILFIFIPLLTSNNKPNTYTGDITSTTQNQKSTAEEDEKRKDLAQSILDAYTKYYEYWVLKKGYNLPQDAEECTTWNGCNLSFPLGAAETPEDYTYSINSLDDGLILSQTGQPPHATTNNVALYKKARCGSNGSVTGGNENINAASVIQLSNGEYYCTQN